MTRWRYTFTPDAQKQFKKLPKEAQRRILTFLTERVLRASSPMEHGKALQGTLRGAWRYRVGDYRLIARFERDIFVVKIIRVGDRRDIYKR